MKMTLTVAIQCGLSTHRDRQTFTSIYSHQLTLIACFLAAGGKQSTWKRPTQAGEEHANFTRHLADQ